MSEQNNSRPQSFSDFKKSAKAISPMGATSLLKYVDPFTDIFFVMAVIFALMKDLVDITVGLLPIIGQVLALVVSILCAIFIFLIMLLLGANKAKSAIKRMLLLLTGSLVDLLPGINFFPIETAIVIIAFLMILKERREKAEAQKNIQTQSAY
jgi:magnesium-transporting ATPase (P-type)